MQIFGSIDKQIIITGKAGVNQLSGLFGTGYDSRITFSFTVTVAAGQTVNLQLSVHTGKTAKVRWGDSRETTVSYSAGNYVSHTNVYAAAGTYNIKIVDADNLKGFRINSPVLSANIVGALPVNLTHVYFNGNSIAWTYSGALPVNLTYVRLTGNSIAWTYTSQSYKSTLDTFLYLPGALGRWLSASVDQVIADLKASGMTGTVNIAGNNEARTSASDQDLIDLRANGATVTVNEY
jgi:hypothetical protein